jgi:aspartate/methionine/tyrosine aminotransferase
MVKRIERQGYLDWAKAKAMGNVLAHSSIDEPSIQVSVTSAYCSEVFREKLEIENQWGHLNLRVQIAARYGIKDTYHEPRILLTPGASNAIYVVCKTFLKAGDEVIIEAPAYEPLLDAAESVGGQVVLWHRQEPTFALNMETFGHLLTEKTRLVILSNPHNPTGAYATNAELKELQRVLSQNALGEQIRVIIDEIFLDTARPPHRNNPLIFEGVKNNGKTAALLGDQFIALNSLSKVYGLSRLRTGWILAAPQAIVALRETYKIVINIGSLDTEAVSSIVFQDMDLHLHRAQEILGANREEMATQMSALFERGILAGDLTDFGCTCFPKLPWLSRLNAQTAGEVIATLDRDCGVVPGSFFGTDYHDYIRIGLGGPIKEFSEAIRNLKRTLLDLHAAHC